MSYVTQVKYANLKVLDLTFSLTCLTFGTSHFLTSNRKAAQLLRDHVQFQSNKLY